MIKQANDEAIRQAADIIRNGGIVGMPTETVYGLAANALDGAAVARVFAAKGRPSFNPLIVHVCDADAAAQYVRMDARAKAVADAFWPGPLTLILPRKLPPSIPPASGGEEVAQAALGGEYCISDLVSAGLPTLAVRVPAHAVAQRLLKACKVPLAAPSANRSGSLSPTTPLHVAEGLGDAVNMILATGACDVGLESTVLDLSGDAPVILRPGAITAEDITAVLDDDVTYDSGNGLDVKSPGQLLKHYAPETPVRLNAIDVKDGEALLAFGPTKFMVGRDFPGDRLRNLSEGQDLYEAAAHLFAMLKDLDRPEHSAIAVMQIPQTGLGIAINDRLRRAAQGSKP
ncbi:MAG: L-threonylcarbamoyladenylate synthase [Bdellovibrionales bacterium]